MISEKRKNGFTLIELLVTIALILSILGIAIVSFVNVSNKKKEEAKKSVEDQILVAAKEYFTSNEYFLEGLQEDQIAVVSLGTLVENDFLNSVTNPVTGKKYDKCLLVKVNSNNEYSLVKKDDILYESVKGVFNNDTCTVEPIVVSVIEKNKTNTKSSNSFIAIFNEKYNGVIYTISKTCETNETNPNSCSIVIPEFKNNSCKSFRNCIWLEEGDKCHIWDEGCGWVDPNDIVSLSEANTDDNHVVVFNSYYTYELNPPEDDSPDNYPDTSYEEPTNNNPDTPSNNKTLVRSYTRKAYKWYNVSKHCSKNNKAPVSGNPAGPYLEYDFKELSCSCNKYSDGSVEVSSYEDITLYPAKSDDTGGHGTNKAYIVYNNSDGGKDACNKIDNHYIKQVCSKNKDALNSVTQFHGVKWNTGANGSSDVWTGGGWYNQAKVRKKDKDYFKNNGGEKAVCQWACES